MLTDVQLNAFCLSEETKRTESVVPSPPPVSFPFNLCSFPAFCMFWSNLTALMPFVFNSVRQNRTHYIHIEPQVLKRGY